jgi:thymidylate synthase
MVAYNKLDQAYFDLVNQVLYYGIEKKDRTGTGTKSIFDYTIKLKMSDGFPILTSKKIYIKGIVYELMWFLGLHLKDPKYKKFGRTNIKYLVDNNVNIWIGDVYKAYKKDANNRLTEEEFIQCIKTEDEFALTYGKTGLIYGQQWRAWKKYGYDGQNGALDCGIITQEEADRESHIDQIEILIEQLKNNPDSRRLIVNSWNCGDLDKMLLPPCHYGFQCWTRELTLDERIKYWCDSIEKNISYGADFGSY